MSESALELTVLGDRTRHRGVKAPEIVPQPWTDGLAVCPALTEFDMIHLGVVTAFKPYRFVRPILSATLFLACLGGEGHVLTDGEWVICKAGSAVLLQPHTPVEYYASGSSGWELVWVCYERKDGKPSVATVSSPGLADYQPQPIFHAVEALRTECLAVNDPVCVRNLVDLVHRLVVRYAEPWRADDRLHQIWEKVATDYAAEWSLDGLARDAHCSAEHLRRLCQQQLGRSPMQHVTYLRLRRATELLSTTDFKVEMIAKEVGYHDPFAFSAMFKKWMGISPTEYRQKGSAARRPA